MRFAVLFSWGAFLPEAVPCSLVQKVQRYAKKRQESPLQGFVGRFPGAWASRLLCGFGDPGCVFWRNRGVRKHCMECRFGRVCFVNKVSMCPFPFCLPALHVSVSVFSSFFFLPCRPGDGVFLLYLFIFRQGLRFSGFYLPFPQDRHYVYQHQYHCDQQYHQRRDGVDAGVDPLAHGVDHDT